MNTRINFSLVLISLVLVNFKIILVNEETLILICFVTFCFLVMSRLSDSITATFATQQKSIKLDFLSSSEKLIQITKQKKQTFKKIEVWSNVFLTLKTNFKNFNNFVLGHFTDLYFANIQKNIQKKLEYSNRLEMQLTKLFVLVITEKLTKISKLQKFYTDVLKVSSFLTIKKIYFREHLQKITK